MKDGDEFNVELTPEMEDGHGTVMSKDHTAQEKAPTVWQNKLRRVVDSFNFERCPAKPSEDRHADDMDLSSTHNSGHVLIMETLKKLHQELQEHQGDKLRRAGGAA